MRRMQPTASLDYLTLRLTDQQKARLKRAAARSKKRGGPGINLSDWARAALLAEAERELAK